MAEAIEQRDFFISFNSADLTYAEAIDAALRVAGFTTFYHPRDLPPGGNIPMWMDDALMNSAQTLALYSPAYTSEKAVYSKAERYASWWDDPESKKRKLVPVVLNKTAITPLIKMISYIDVIGRNPMDAAAHVVARLKTPGEAEQRGVLRAVPEGQVFNVIYRPNPNFTGRFEALDSLQRSLRAGTSVAITAVAGMGGIGKTTLAAEYCYRFRWLYAGIWWIRAEQEPVMLSDLQALGQRLGVIANANTETDARAALDHLLGLTEPWLLVYDNAPNPDAVARWLPTGAVRCIITSRFAEFGGIATVTKLDQWSDEVTADYLLARTERNDKNGALRLAEALGGLPLAAEQAAVFLKNRKGISFDDYANELARLIKEGKPVGSKGDYPDTVFAAFSKSLETLSDVKDGKTALNILRLCSFLSPDGVDLSLLLIDREGTILPADFAAAMSDKFSRESALAALMSLSLLRQENGPAGSVLIFHRLLLEVARDLMGVRNHSLWGAVAVRLIRSVFPLDARSETSSWPRCARLMPHMAPLNAYTSRIADASESLILLLDRASGYLSARGNRAGAAMMAREAISLARQNVRVPPLEFARLLNNFAMFNSELGELDVAEAAFKEVLDITDKHLPSDDPRLAIAFSNVGGIHWKRKEFGRAEPHFLRALEILKANHREKTREYGTLLSNLGTLYSDWAEEPGEIARRKQEEEYKTAALAVTRAICGSRDPQMAVRLHNLAALRASQKNWPAAAAEAERSVSIMLSLELDEHPNMQQTVRLLILAWGQLGHQARAQRLKDGDTTDLLPTITEIEVEHRAWVAEDPERRHFGPPSPFGSEN